jgi:hypothetical protein
MHVMMYNYIENTNISQLLIATIQNTFDVSIEQLLYAPVQSKKMEETATDSSGERSQI